MPQSYKDATPKQRKVVCNGCCPGSWKWDCIPDYIWGVCITSACDIHDWRFHEGGWEDEFKIANNEFLQNIYYSLELNLNWMLPFAKFRARFWYFRMVKKYGRKHFNWRLDHD